MGGKSEPRVKIVPLELFVKRVHITLVYAFKSLNPNPRARKAYLTRNRVSYNVVATPGFDPRTSRTPAFVIRQAKPLCVAAQASVLVHQRLGAHIGVPVMMQSHLMHFSQ